MKARTAISLSALGIALAATRGRGRRPLLAHEGHETFSAGEPGDPKKPARIVKIKMREETARRCSSSRP